MALLNLPDEYVNGLAILSELTDDRFQALASALDTASFTLRARSIISDVSSKISDLSKEEIANIVEMLISMSIVRRNAEVDITQFLGDVAEAIEEYGDPEVIVADEELRERLSRLLSVKALEVVSRARSVAIDHERRFCSSRIATDISPVFGDDAEKPPMAAVITHALRVSFHLDSNEIKEFFVVMDGDDLQELRRAIDRAEQKAKSLKSMLESAQLPYLE